MYLPSFWSSVPVWSRLCACSQCLARDDVGQLFFSFLHLLLRVVNRKARRRFKGDHSLFTIRRLSGDCCKGGGGRVGRWKKKKRLKDNCTADLQSFIKIQSVFHVLNALCMHVAIRVGRLGHHRPFSKILCHKWNNIQGLMSNTLESVESFAFVW